MAFFMGIIGSVVKCRKPTNKLIAIVLIISYLSNMNNSSIRRLKAEFGGVAKYICISQARCFLFLLHAMAENVMSSESVLQPMVSKGQD